MGYLNKAIRKFVSRVAFAGAWETASGATTLTKKSGHFQRIDPGGGAVDVTLPSVDRDDDGYFFVIANAADAAEAITVKDAAASTIATVSQNELGVVYVDTSAAWQLLFIVTGAPS